MNMTSGVVIRSPARIACCLLDLNGELGRVDGTLGFAVAHPLIEVVASEADTLDLAVADSVVPAVEAGVNLAAQIIGSTPLVTIELRRWIEPHVGLGHKTQTMLAVAWACLRATGNDTAPNLIAGASGRGGTSGAGIHTFLGGGIVVDAGHKFGPAGKRGFAPSSAATNAGMPPLVTRVFPPKYLRVVLGIVPCFRGVSDKPEIDFFSRFCPVPRAEANKVIANVYMKLLPALAEGDIPQINDGIRSIQNTEFKRMIWNDQAEPIRRIFHALSNECPNVGLSSMGPTMYTITDEANAEACAQAYREQFARSGLQASVISTHISPTGARVV
jgi:beta-ribofuranosylaminobenzene 5'-phosphate synthase